MNIKVLIVDDNKTNIRLFQEILEDEGFATDFCSESLLALEKVRSFMPDIILLDIMMPNIDGFEVCKLIKSDFVLSHIPIIMITAKTGSTDVKKALELGAFDYVKKPVDDIEVIARIHSAFKYKEIQDALREMAMKDGLTGIYNHSLIVELLEKELASCDRMDKAISYAMIDIDYFKRINDVYGHMAGDMILMELSTILQSSVRGSDIVGRYGGEEFSIIFPDLECIEAFEVCERIRKKIESREFHIEHRIINITISIGICTKSIGCNLNISEFIKKADAALYNAKRNGRNRVEAAD